MNVLGAIARQSMLFALPIAQAYAEGNMLARVRVTRGKQPVFDPATGTAALEPGLTIYEGPGRVYTVQGAQQLSVGDEPTYYSSTMVSIPVAAPRPQVDDDVLILEHQDPGLAGRSFNVDSVEGGGQLPTVHRMQVTGIAPSPQWESP